MGQGEAEISPEAPDLRHSMTPISQDPGKEAQEKGAVKK